MKAQSARQYQLPDPTAIQTIEPGPSEVPNTTPFFGMAFVDSEDRLWVSAASWPSQDATPRHWSVFSKNGVWLGDLDAPEGVRIVDSCGDLVLGIWHDEMDIPYVQLHRMIGE